MALVRSNNGDRNMKKQDWSWRGQERLNELGDELQQGWSCVISNHYHIGFRAKQTDPPGI